jgi:hypothetical protein
MLLHAASKEHENAIVNEPDEEARKPVEEAAKEHPEGEVKPRTHPWRMRECRRN